ncbi:hypothetical protein niasHS_007410 [Heterodera schachtii]|uniref:Apple domain-containing protein n=1 Tax=Heterodera schachtii TaxID=97005 RepID=A0ABD2JXE6_HETSC
MRTNRQEISSNLLTQKTPLTRPPPLSGKSQRHSRGETLATRTPRRLPRPVFAAPPPPVLLENPQSFTGFAFPPPIPLKLFFSLPRIAFPLPFVMPFPFFFQLFFLFFFFFVTSISSFQFARCFQKLERHSIDNSQPLTEIFRSAPTDCLEQCISHTGNGDEQENPGYCRSVVYDHLQHSCRLYGHDGSKVPALIHPANGFDLYKRTSSMQECVGPTQRLLALNAKKGAVFAAPSQVQSVKGKTAIPVTTPMAEDETLSDEELATLLDQLERKDEKGTEIVRQRHEGEGKVAKGQSAVRVIAEAGRKMTKAESAGGVVTELDCAAFGRVTGYLSYIGGQPIEEAEEFMGWSETECAQFCTSNQDPEGKVLACAGFSHVPGGSKCFLHSKISSKVPNAPGPSPTHGGTYAEKWCVPAHRFGICRESVRFHVRLQQRFSPNFIPLVGMDQIHTLTECLNKCMDHQNCQSASFHAQSLRCLLYDQFPSADILFPADQSWALAVNGCVVTKAGQVGAVDNEDGQIASTKVAQQKKGVPNNQKAFGVANRPCGGGENGGIMANLFGKK